MVVYQTDYPWRIPEEFRPEVNKYLRQAGSVRVVIAPAFKRRSKEQNAIFHAKINEISRLTGMDKERVKKEVKEVAVSFGYPPELDDEGKPLFKDGYIIPLSTAKASIGDFTILINAVDAWCDEHGLELSEIWNY